MLCTKISFKKRTCKTTHKALPGLEQGEQLLATTFTLAMEKGKRGQATSNIFKPLLVK